MSANIEYLYDKDGNIILPKTVTKAITDENGNRLDRVIHNKYKAITDNWQGKGYNLIPFPYENYDRVIGDISWTINQDGSVVANGTATAMSNIVLTFSAQNNGLKLEQNKKYFISGCPNGGGEVGYRIGGNFIVNNASIGPWGWDYGEGCLIETNETDRITIFCSVTPGTTVSNLTFKPMIVEVADDGSYPTEYQRYANGNVELTDTTNNLVNVMNYKTDKIGVGYADVPLTSAITNLVNAVFHSDRTTSISGNIYCTNPDDNINQQHFISGVIHENKWAYGTVFPQNMSLNGYRWECQGGASTVISPFKSGEEPVLLWENPKPNVAFAGQTISMDLSQYSHLLVTAAVSRAYYSGKDYVVTSYIPIDGTYYTLHTSVSLTSNAHNARNITAYSDRIVFGDGYATGNKNNDSCIPLAIYGVPTEFEVVTKNIVMQEWLTASRTTAYTMTKDYEYVTILSGNTVTFSGNVGETLVSKQQIIGSLTYYYYVFKDVKSGTIFTPASTSYGMQITAIPYV